MKPPQYRKEFVEKNEIDDQVISRKSHNPTVMDDGFNLSMN